jgi:hypothetical protein
MLSEKCGIEGYRTRSESIFSGNGICACAPSKIQALFFFYVERVNIKDFFSLFTCHADFSGYGCLGGCTRGHA